MNNLSFHHIGIACEDINNCLEFLKTQFDIQGYSDIVFDSKQDAYLCMVSIKNNDSDSKFTRLELISGKIVAGILKKRLFLYHTCYVVRDIESKITELVNAGYIVISPLKKAVLFGGRRVCFLSGNMGIIEILESEN